MSEAIHEQYVRTDHNLDDIDKALITIRTAPNMPFTAENKVQTAAQLLLDAANIILANDK